MAKTRLLKAHKELLMDFVEDRVDIPELKDAHEKAEAELQQKALEHALKAYPTKDMKILLKYGCAAQMSLLDVWNEKKEDQRYRGCKKFELPKTILMPNNHTVDHIPKLFDLSKKKNEAWVEYASSLADLRRKYKILITESRYYEDLVEIWPEAAELEVKIKKPNTALSVLSPDVIKTIKKDCKKRMQSANKNVEK